MTAIDLELRRGTPRPPRYAELERELSCAESSPLTASSVRESVLALRRGKSMVIDPGDPNRRSVGSFFLNPILDEEGCSQLAERALYRTSR